MSKDLTGACLCGAVRYRVVGAPLEAGYCHCRMCQRASGAPTQAWATYPIERLTYEGTAPQIYRSSRWGERRFCGACGSQLEFREAEEPTTVSLNLGTLDDPETVAPQMHIYCSSRLPWFETDDDLPRYPEDSG
ncbi:MAG: GFA family protein [Pseudomonadota bacterium]